MHKPLDRNHVASSWLTVRETLGPKKKKITSCWHILKNKQPLVTLLLALPTLPAIANLFTWPIILLALLNLHLLLAPHRIIELASARIIRLQLISTNPRHLQ